MLSHATSHDRFVIRYSSHSVHSYILEVMILQGAKQCAVTFFLKSSLNCVGVCYASAQKREECSDWSFKPGSVTFIGQFTDANIILVS